MARGPLMLAIVMLATLARVAWAQPAPVLPGASAYDEAPEVEHGWLIEPDPQGSGFFLVHAPPRAGPADAVAGEGALRRVERLERTPGAMAARGSRVYLGFADGVGTVLSLDAELAGAGLYRYVPSGRLRAEPPAGPGLVALAAGTGRVWALRRSGGQWSLAELAGAAWAPVEWPPIDAGAGDAWVVGEADAVALGVRAANDGGVRWWRLLRSEERADGEASWVEQRVGDAPPGDARPPAGAIGAALVEGELWWVARAASRWEFVPIDGRGAIAVSTLPGAASVAIFPASARVVALSLDSARPGPLGEPARRVDEVSLRTGRVLFSGAPRSGAPVTPQDARLLAMALVALLAAAVFYVLRSERRPGLVRLPAGASLAEPGRRVAATAADWVIGAVAASLLMDVDLAPVVMVAPALALPGGSAGVLAAWGLAAGLSAVVEGLTGATLGKVLVGCRVVRVLEPGMDRARGPGPVRAAVRQVFKWAFLPWAAAGVSSLERRHRGDIVAGCAVVVVRAPADHNGSGREGE